MKHAEWLSLVQEYVVQQMCPSRWPVRRWPVRCRRERALAQSQRGLECLEARIVLTFAAKTDFSTGPLPSSVEIGDLNGDGKLDLVTANESSNTVSVLLNTTMPGAITPTFAEKTDFATGTTPFSVAIGDLNGDGNPDLAVTNFSSNTVSVLLNTTVPGATTPTFAAKTDFGTGPNPISVAIGDLNGDGNPDLAIANLNNNTNTVSVLLNTTPTEATTPTFADKTDFATGRDPYSVAIGDLNDDGKPDLAIANTNSNTVSVLLNTTTPGATTPTFTSKTDFATGSSPASVAIGDLNGDGKSDLAIANLNSISVSVLLNTTTAEATTPTFADKTDFTTGESPYTVAIGDLNDDGKPDLVTANYNPGTASLLLNTTTEATTPTFLDKSDFSTGLGSISVAIGDLNGDSKADLAISNLLADTVSVLLRKTTKTVTLPATAGNVTALIVGGMLHVRRSRNSPDLIAPVALDHVSAIQFQGSNHDDRLTLDRSLSVFQGSILFNGGNGSDSLNARAIGLDITFDGGNGNDTLLGGSGDDAADGGAGIDSLSGGDGNDSLIGGLGSDRLTGDAGDDSVTGGTGSDSINGGVGNDMLRGEAGNDTLSGSAGGDNLDGGDDNDSVIGGDGRDLLNGGAGNDRLQGDEGDDVLFGGTGNESLNGGAGNDTVLGEAGNDTLNGDSGNDVIDGGDDNDSLIGFDGDDSLRGGNGNDTLNGGNGNDLLTGSAGNDKLYGMSGTDTLLGDSGNDILSGGAGIDTINPGPPDTDHDIISDGTAFIDTAFTFDFDALLNFG